MVYLKFQRWYVYPLLYVGLNDSSTFTNFNGEVISSHTLLVMRLIIHAGIKLIRVSKQGSRGDDILNER